MTKYLLWIPGLVIASAWVTSSQLADSRAECADQPNAAPMPATQHGRALVRIRVPTQAAVWVEGSPTRQLGPERVFVSPPLQGGSTYLYTIRASWMEKGQPVRREEQVRVRAGQTTLVNFTRAAEPQQLTSQVSDVTPPQARDGHDRRNEKRALRMIEEGRQTFRFDTFGDEEFWGGNLRLHEAIVGVKLGGVGPGLSPKAALGLGLKVDMDALPPDLVRQVKAGQVNLDDPATTMELLKLNAVVGVKGFLDGKGQARSIGITCALCHSSVDDAFSPGIGHRLDGWANRDLDVGKIIALAPNLQPLTERLGMDEPALKAALQSWGPGKYDAELLHDGKAARPDGKSAATLLPPAFGLAGVNNHTWTGWGSVTHWNAYVANTQMRGKGTFFDPRLNDPAKFPLAVKTGDWNIRNQPDLVTAKLPGLHLYQLSIDAPTPPADSFDQAAAQRGKALFMDRAQCARCHVPPLFTEPGWPMHTAAEIGIDDFQAKRSPDERYRTAPLRGLWTHMKGGFYHDGRFATLPDVIQHYNRHFKLDLKGAEVQDLVEYLKSL